MLFALSKQYSEHLSESVQRGVDSNLEQGKSGGMPKWGYIRDDVSGYYKPDKKMQEATVEKHELLGQKTQKQRKIDDLVEKDILVRNMVSNLDKTRRRAKIKCLHFIFRDDEVFSRREIDAQKRVICRYKSPFNFIFEPEFFTGSPVGELGGARTHDTLLKRQML